MLFSQRIGFKPIKNIIQVESMDDDLRIGLWNALSLVYWNSMKGKNYLYQDDDINFLVSKIWSNFFKKPLDSMHKVWDFMYSDIRNFFMKCEWYEVYDFIEFVVDNYPHNLYNNSEICIILCNATMEKEVSAYRFVDGKIMEITSKVEVDEIESALDETRSSKTVHTHLKRSLDLLTDRKNPDYRNSIKESISAVEAMCKLISGDSKASLGKALNQIEKSRAIVLHSALKDAFTKLYGYTSDADGIRHALMDESSISFEDAKFMLVSCSAFVNYLLAKSRS